MLRTLNNEWQKIFENIAIENTWDYNESGKFIDNVQKYERYKFS